MLDSILLAPSKKSDKDYHLIFNLRETYNTNCFIYKITNRNNIKIIFSMYLANRRIKVLYIPFWHQNIKIEESWKAQEW